MAGKAGSIEVFRAGSRIATLVNITDYSYNNPKLLPYVRLNFSGLSIGKYDQGRS